MSNHEDPLDRLAQESADWDQSIKGMIEGGKLAAAIHKGLVDGGMTSFHAAIVTGTALQAVFLNQGNPEEE